MTMRVRWLGVSLVVGWMAASVGSATAAPPLGSGRALLERLVDVLATGDQAAYERFIEKYYAPAALAEFGAEDRASSFARIYTDTGGFTLERVVRETADWVQAEGRDQMVRMRYCLTLKRSVRMHQGPIDRTWSRA
jgi:hypothetical protein